MNGVSPNDVKEWFDCYYQRLCSFAYRIVACEDTAKDLVQDAFVTLLEGSLRNTRDPNVVKSYLYTTVKHAAFNRVRHLKIASRIHEQHLADTVEESKVLEALIRAEVAGEIQAALATLPKGCAEVCKLGYLEGMKNIEIAEALQISINTVKTQKQRAIMLLRSKLTSQTLAVLILVLNKTH